MNFKKMKSFDVLGKKIKVIFRDMTEEAICGHYLYMDNIIEVNTAMNRETQEVTLIHELVHAVMYRSGVTNTKISSDTEEVICDQVAKVITENFKLVKK